MNPELPNGGSPIAPGFVVYERANGEKGYDLEMALASVGKGWHPLLKILFDTIAWDREHNKNIDLGGMYLTQVKEKFGTLCLHFNIGPGEYRRQEADGFIRALEAVSAHICEDCGKPGKTGAVGWIRTQCEECRNAKQ